MTDQSEEPPDEVPQSILDLIEPSQAVEEPSVVLAPPVHRLENPKGATQSGIPQESVQLNALNTEFLYYSSVLKIIAPSLTNQADKENLIPWIRKLFRPEYQSTSLREKRNKYLATLTVSLLNDELVGAFSHQPTTDGPLPDLSTIPEVKTDAASWELDKLWQETLQLLPNNFHLFQCQVHPRKEECKKDHRLDRILDQEFQFYLYLARPFIPLLNFCEDRTKVSCWIQSLCSICGKSCSSLKAIRNDYMMALLGYLQDLRVAGPFSEKPPVNVLNPISVEARRVFNNSPITDPSNVAANEFLQSQPVPDDGAFCYIALSGDLIETNFGGPAP